MSEMIIHKGERFERVYLNEPGLDLHFVQEAGSALKIHVLNIPDGVSRYRDIEISNNIVVEQTGEGCRTEIYGLAYLRGEEKVTMETHVHHSVGGGTSDQLVKFVPDGRACGHFIGDLKIAPNAQKTEAHQTNRNLVLSEEAEMRTQPQLEIYADDVQATHGASTGQLDESALFYMQQRGIGKEKARQLLVNAFMTDVLASVSDEETRARLLDTIDGVIK